MALRSVVVSAEVTATMGHLGVRLGQRKEDWHPNPGKCSPNGPASMECLYYCQAVGWAATKLLCDQ